MHCRKEMVKILKCYLIPKKSYGTLSKGAIFFGQPCIKNKQNLAVRRYNLTSKTNTQLITFRSAQTTINHTN